MHNSTSVIKRTLSLFLVGIMVISLLPMSVMAAKDNTESVAAEAANIVYKGAITYGLSTVGDFTINGKQAFCLQHPKGTPSTGAGNNGLKPYDNDFIRRILYYGWGGPENIFGKDRARGIVVTSLVLSKYYNGDISGTSIPGWSQLDNLAKSGEIPDNKLSASKSNLAITIKNGKQISESTTIKGWAKNKMTVSIPKGLTLVNETQKKNTSNGKATIYGGDTIHLEAGLDYTKSWSSGTVKGNVPDFQPLIVVPTNSNLQNVGTWRYHDDPTQSITIKANFFARSGDLNIVKTSEDDIVANVSFKIAGNGVDKTVKTGADGKAVLTDLPTGKYTVTEMMDGEKYTPQKPQTVTVQSGKTVTATFNNVLTKVKFSITKVDALATGFGLLGAEFTIYEDKNCTRVATNKNGSNKTADNKIVCGAEGYGETVNHYDINQTYYFKETKVPEGYRPTDTVFEYTPKIADSGKTIAIGEPVVVGVDNKGNNIIENLVANMTDKIPGKVTIGKLDSNSSLISGATFKVYAESDFKNTEGKIIYKKGQFISTLKMGNKMAVDLYIPNIGNGGSVKITEYKAPLGFYATDHFVIVEFPEPTTENIITTDTPFVMGTVTKVSDTSLGGLVGQHAVRFKNQPVKGKLQIEKLDFDKNHPIKGAEFTVYAAEDIYKTVSPAVKLYSSGDKIATLDMTNKTVGTLNNIQIGAGGKVKIVETKAPAGYILDTTPHYMYFDSSKYDENGIVTAFTAEDTSTVLKVTNKRIKGKIKINKQAEDNLVENVVFTVAGNGETYTLTTDEEGISISEDLPVYNMDGNKITYLIKENDVPLRYVAPTDQSLSLIADETVSVTFENKLKHGKVLINKQAEDNQIQDVSFSITDGQGNEQIGMTNDKGTTLFDNLPVYNTANEKIEYLIYENDAPLRYVAPADQATTLTADETVALTFNNRLKKTGIVINKQAEDGNVGDRKFIVTGSDGSRYELTTNKEGKAELLDLVIYDNKNHKIKYTVSENDVPIAYITPADQEIELAEDLSTDVSFYNALKKGSIKVIKTAEDGFVEGVKFRLFGTSMSGAEVEEFAVTNAEGIARFKNILIGTYTIEEIETKDQYIVPQAQEVTVHWNEVTEATFENRLKRGDLQIVKNAEDGFVEGVKFRLFGTSMSGTEVEELAVTNAEGIAHFENILIGTYTVEETETKEQYIIPEAQEVTVFWDEVTYTAFDNVLKRGYLEVVKTADDHFVEGIKFRLFGTSLSGANVDEFAVTNAEGIAKFEHILIGDYTLEELETAERYVLPNTQEVTINWDEAKQTTVHNKIKTGGLELTKTDVSTGNPLPNAGFELKNANGKVIAKGRSDKNGLAKFDHLPYGKYTYREYEAPEGYLIDKGEYAFEIKEDGQIVKAAMTNEKKPDKITAEPTPDTGSAAPSGDGISTGDNTNPFFAIYMAIGALMLIILLVVTKKRNSADN